MPLARDALHHVVRRALEKAGWHITDDPLRIVIGSDTLLIDLAAERLIVAEKASECIAVEVKGYTDTLNINGFHAVLGQYINYRLALRTTYPRYKLYLAVPDEVFETFFKREFAQMALEENRVALLVYNVEREVIVGD